MSVQEASRTHLSNYVRLFVELHRLVASGTGDSHEADELRDQLDRPWHQLSDAEKRMADMLAADLYDFDNGRYEMVSVEQLVIDLHLFEIAGLGEAPETKGVRNELEHRSSHLDSALRERQKGLLADLRSVGVCREAKPTDSKQAAHDFETATKRHDWDLALTILREHDSEIPPAEISAIRGVCWGQLGNHEIAALFFSDAVRQNPANLEVVSCYLRSLIRCGRTDDAQRKACFIANRETDPYRLLLAADILFDCLDSDGKVAPAPSEFERIVNLVERAAVGHSRVPSDSTLRQIACSGYLAAALSCEHLEDKPRADEMYRMAHQFYDSSRLSEEAHLAGDKKRLPTFEATRRERTAVIDEVSKSAEERILRAA